MNKYKDNLLNSSSKLDSLLEESDKIKADIVEITEYNNFDVVVPLFKKFSKIIDSKIYNDEIKKYINLTKESLLLYLGYLKILDIYKKEKVEENPKGLEELLNELNSLVGLKVIKKKIKNN